jgi:REP element-mobilizing transposase RayT
MKTNIEPLQPDSFYHIYNRGINGENIFKEERNYSFFLERYAHYIEPFAETYAYCLLKNHFHLLIRTRPEIIIRQKLTNLHAESSEESNVIVQRKPSLHLEKPIEWMLGNSFSSLFKSYSQSINNTHNRTGRLFEQPFRRILVDSDDYFTELIYYIHHNPQNHGFVEDFKLYPYSSYHSHLSSALTKLRRDEVIDWFGNREAFKKFHSGNQNLDNLGKFRIEFD